ncbi:MAG: hypothetical protein SOW59_03470 [Corynebacterium sp.]|nr:hypothetical protein [Corynebacterium sp.]
MCTSKSPRSHVPAAVLASCLLALGGGALTACSPPDPVGTSVTNTTSDTSSESGSTYGGQEIDLREVRVGDRTFPARGVVFAAHDGADNNEPIVILSHLRAPTCSDESFEYPCPAGTEQLRYDTGMAYLGRALADQGFNVVIPDLTAVVHGGDVFTPYDQPAAWSAVVTPLLANVPGDPSRVGLVAHSRSAAFVDRAVADLGVDAVVSYGGFYDETSPAAHSDTVPVLELTGSLDSDVGLAAPKWVSAHPDAGNIESHVIPGLGHMLVNENMDDERIGCDVLDCPDAAAHKEIITAAALQWFRSALIDNVSSPQWETKYNSASTRSLRSGSIFVGPDAFSGVKLCTVPEPMGRELPPSLCPDPDDGVLDAFYTTQLGVVSDSASVAFAQPLRLPELLVAPLATAKEATALSVTLDLVMPDGSGAKKTVDIPAHHPALATLGDDTLGGTYLISGIKLADATDDIDASTVITGLTLHSPKPFILRGVVGR